MKLFLYKGFLYEISHKGVPRKGEVYLFESNNQNRIAKCSGSARNEWSILKISNRDPTNHHIFENDLGTGLTLANPLQKPIETKQETTMSIINSIKKQTLINNNEISNYDDNQLIALMLETEAEIVRLSEIKVVSKAIKKRIDVMVKDVDAVAKILDAR